MGYLLPAICPMLIVLEYHLAEINSKFKTFRTRVYLESHQLACPCLVANSNRPVNITKLKSLLTYISSRAPQTGTSIASMGV